MFDGENYHALGCYNVPLLRQNITKKERQARPKPSLVYSLQFQTPLLQE